MTTFDGYRHRIKRAAWTWLEAKVVQVLRSPRRKDRKSGRADKRGARQREREERDRP